MVHCSKPRLYIMEKTFLLFMSLLCLVWMMSMVSCAEVLSDNEYGASLNLTTDHRRLRAEYWHKLHSLVKFKRLKEIIGNNSDYSQRYPFPHMYVDHIFPMEVLLAATEEIPDNPQKKDGCVLNSQHCFKNAKTEKNKNAFDSDHSHGPATSALFAYLKSSQFIRFLESLTGIVDLIPDPHFRGSGVHQTLPGGYLNVHADFNRYKRYNLHRRVNVFIYLNPDWEDGYGGHLELWSRDLRSCGAMIRPDLGRLVVFSSTDFSYHGHPNALMCPLDRSRRSLAMYYYTTTRPSSECVWWSCDMKHSTLWQTPACESCSNKKCKRYDKIQ